MRQTEARGKRDEDQDLADHITSLINRWSEGLQRSDFDAVWLAAGEAHNYFQDDHGPSFKPNPYFTQLVDPTFAHAGAHCFIKPGQKPHLFVLQPTDYWYAPGQLPDYLSPHVELSVFSTSEELLAACRGIQTANSSCAYIGQEMGNESLGTPNPANLLAYMDYHRATKSEYELTLMRKASEIGVKGHLAAERTFTTGGSEFDIHMAYLQASGQTELEIPYGNIVALNEHGATLHYQFQERSPPSPVRSLLIDAGGNYAGYASDITRTYTMDPSSDFAGLIASMQIHQDKIIAGIRTGESYAQLHESMHRSLASVLADAGLVNCSADEAFALGITEKFCPHGLGHLLGIQVHDVGGHLADDTGQEAPPPSNYPSLRFTRDIEVNQVFTIEPGLYFIESLLAELKTSNADINWPLVDELTVFGGIRIEDNIRVLDDGTENLTRDAWQKVTLAS
ncbi:MAG: Xaa-Pro dipeptidase [Pseudomonadales bacterium]|nr:Xaa-Pro dipeptidase [Pseudomonadales bacterium]